MKTEVKHTPGPWVRGSQLLKGDKNMKPTTEKTLKEIEQIEKEIFGNVSTVEFVPPEMVAEILKDEVTQ